MITGMNIVRGGQVVATAIRRSTPLHWMLNYRLVTPEGIKLPGEGYRTINDLHTAVNARFTRRAVRKYIKTKTVVKRLRAA